MRHRNSGLHSISGTIVTESIIHVSPLVLILKYVQNYDTDTEHNSKLMEVINVKLTVLSPVLSPVDQQFIQVDGLKHLDFRQHAV